MNEMTHKHDNILSLYEIYLNTDIENLQESDNQYGLHLDTIRLGDYLTTCHELDPDHPLVKLVQKVDDNLCECIGEPTEEQEKNIIESVKELIEELRNYNNKKYEEYYNENLSHERDWKDFHNTLKVTKEFVDKGELDKVKTNLDHLEYLSQFL